MAAVGLDFNQGLAVAVALRTRRLCQRSGKYCLVPPTAKFRTKWNDWSKGACFVPWAQGLNKLDWSNLALLLSTQVQKFGSPF